GLSGRHSAGSRVEYYSQTAARWVPAIVLGFDENSGTYQLDIHQGADPQKVRGESLSAASDDIDRTGGGAPLFRQRPRHIAASGYAEEEQQSSSSSSAPGPRSQQLRQGDPAEYFSTTHGGWVPAVVLDFDEKRGAYILNIQPIAFPNKVRPAPEAVGAADAQEKHDADRQGPSHGSSEAGGRALPRQLQWQPCGLCKAVCFTDDLMTCGCEHRFCGPCLQKHILRLDFLRERVRCPSCTEEFGPQQ
ncbi:unnamed protein product, partial [Polarella glacialis]